MKPASVFAALTIALTASVGAAVAQDYPSRAVTIVVPFSAGGPTDTVARLIATAMSKELGQQVLVQNVGGAGGTVGSGQVAVAAPDGYTLLLHSIGLSTAPTLYRKLAFDPVEDFSPIGQITTVPMTIIARRDLPPADGTELAAFLKANAADIDMAHAGIGTSSWLCGQLLQSTLGAEFVALPYQGTGPALADIVGGQVDLLCDQTTNTTNQIAAGEVKAYAVTTPQRLASLPDLPTAKEIGLGGVEFGVWHGLYAPAGVDPAITARLETALKAALQDETVVTRFRELGTEPGSLEDATPASLADQLSSQIALWKPIIEAAGQYAD